MAPLFAASSHASVLPLFSPDPATARLARGTLRSRTSSLRLRGAPRAAGRGRGRGRGIPDEWGERSPPGAPEPPAQPDTPIDDDEWGRDAAEGNSRPIVVDEWGEPGEPEPEPLSAADPPSPAVEDEWGKEPKAPAPSAEEEVDEQAERREELKRCLVDTVYGSELGFRASTEVRGEVVELVTQLEAANPTPAPVEAPDLLDGNWILIYTAYSELLPILAAGATPFVKVKQISQEIDSKSMTIVNASTLTTPFASFSFSATASFEVQSPSRIEVQFKEGSFQPPAISSSVDLPEQVDIFGQKINLGPVQQALNPLQQAFASIAGSISGQPPLKVPIPGNNRGRSWLLTTYLDKDFRISRGDGGLFILAKEGSPFLNQL
ncbi:putative plastid-lipid-associated protein 3, chloroplastic [Dichanthelium oligosanthes]|uniref:Putative plastid-lipid-associated protein 3, chloroplastic n=1 Tax=Dichanthelium oligosanthes TaxID=888268 RepID=A0A1E5V9T5_9POAL|nr:putative plastid-lipid-associated protein 3, chloroplastic [Dichanthelium oligosanthes]